MSFLNAALLFAAAAFVVPLSIHLLNRSRLQRIDWGAMQFLEEALQSNSRAVDWRAWLLLILRCVIPMLLAICLARPVLTSIKSDRARGPQDIYFVVDDSISMSQSFVDADDKSLTPLQSATRAGWMIAQQFATSQFTLLTSGNLSPSHISKPARSQLELRDQLESLSADSGSFAPLTALRFAIEAANEASLAGRHVILASDFRSSDWQAVTSEELKNLRNIASQADSPVSIALLPVSPRGMPTNNPSIRLSLLEEAPHVVGESIPLKVELQNIGDSGEQDVSLDFYIDAERIEDQVFRVSDGSNDPVVFDCQFVEAGWHHVQCRLTNKDSTADGLMQDDVANLVLHVIEPPEVWIVDNDSKQDRAAENLELALAPFKAAASESNRFRVARLAASELTTRLKSGSPQILVLAGVPRLNSDALEAIRELMHRGMGLWVFPSTEIDIDWYRRTLAPDLPLPYTYGELVGSDPPSQLKRQEIGIPELEIFLGEQAGNLSDLRFSRWFEMQPAPDSVAAEASTVPPSTFKPNASIRPPQVLWQLPDGSPLLIAQEIGAGRLVQSAICLEEDWSNLPSRTVFVPWMQQMAWASLPVRISPNKMSGETVQVVLESNTLQSTQPTQATDFQSRNTSDHRGRGAESSAYVLQVDEVGSDRRVLSKALDEASRNIAFPIREPGLFRLELNLGPGEDLKTNTASRYVAPELVSVAIPSSESDLQTLSDSQIQKLASELGGTVAESAEQFSSQRDLYRFGREIWRPLVILVLLVLFAELMLAKTITRSGL